MISFMVYFSFLEIMFRPFHRFTLGLGGLGEQYQALGETISPVNPFPFLELIVLLPSYYSPGKAGGPKLAQNNMLPTHCLPEYFESSMMATHCQKILQPEFCSSYFLQTTYHFSRTSRTPPVFLHCLFSQIQF
jgi:hypothetical protein